METREQILSRVKDEVARKNHCKSFSEHLYGGNCQLIDVELIAIRFNEEMEKQKATCAEIAQVQPEEVKSLPSAEAELLDNKKKAILHNALAECYNIHNIKISEKYTPFLIVAMESYKTLCVEQERKAWEKEKEAYAVDQVAKAIQTMSYKRY